MRGGQKDRDAQGAQGADMELASWLNGGGGYQDEDDPGAYQARRQISHAEALINTNHSHKLLM